VRGKEEPPSAPPSFPPVPAKLLEAAQERKKSQSSNGAGVFPVIENPENQGHEEQGPETQGPQKQGPEKQSLDEQGHTSLQSLSSSTLVLSPSPKPQIHSPLAHPSAITDRQTQPPPVPFYTCYIKLARGPALTSLRLKFLSLQNKAELEMKPIRAYASRGPSAVAPPWLTGPLSGSSLSVLAPLLPALGPLLGSGLPGLPQLPGGLSHFLSAQAEKTRPTLEERTEEESFGQPGGKSANKGAANGGRLHQGVPAMPEGLAQLMASMQGLKAGGGHSHSAEGGRLPSGIPGANAQRPPFELPGLMAAISNNQGTLPNPVTDRVKDRGQSADIADTQNADEAGSVKMGPGSMQSTERGGPDQATLEAVLRRLEGLEGTCLRIERAVMGTLSSFDARLRRLEAHDAAGAGSVELTKGVKERDGGERGGDGKETGESSMVVGFTGGPLVKGDGGFESSGSKERILGMGSKELEDKEASMDFEADSKGGAGEFDSGTVEGGESEESLLEGPEKESNSAVDAATFQMGLKSLEKLSSETEGERPFAALRRGSNTHNGARLTDPNLDSLGNVLYEEGRVFTQSSDGGPKRGGSVLDESLLSETGLESTGKLLYEEAEAAAVL
jgi:hypothetical protein